MKTVKSIIASIVAGIVLLLPSGCNRGQESILDMTILMDNTDSFENAVGYQDIRPIYDFDRFLWLEHNLRIREISDVEEGLVSEVHLPQGNTREQTDEIRKGQIRQYLKRNEELFDREVFQVSDKAQSHIYVAIARELNRLAIESTATNRVCIINSDLHEHSSLFDVYDPWNKDLLIYHPDSVIKIFNRRLALEDLHGIQVVIVYRATTQSNETYSHMARLYQMMLGLKGAKVTITGSFNPSDLNLLTP